MRAYLDDEWLIPQTYANRLLAESTGRDINLTLSETTGLSRENSFYNNSFISCHGTAVIFSPILTLRAA